MSSRYLLFLYLLLVTLYVESYFTPHFVDFLEEQYGSKFTNMLQRSDLGAEGAFGGKADDSDTIRFNPIVFVHGVSDSAGVKMREFAKSLEHRGYELSELYGTTYGKGNRGNPIQWTEYSLNCEFVKQIRAMILAVKLYTNRNVDVVAYSIGVPLARKAVLGGFCVDTEEDLGNYLTNHVDNFIGIAGPNYGIAPKVGLLTIPACVLGVPAICDRVTGLYSGICPLKSTFLNNINERSHYEGTRSFSIYSQNDQLTGYKVCDKITSSIPGEDGHKSYINLSHDQLLTETVDVVFNFLNNNRRNIFSQEKYRRYQREKFGRRVESRGFNRELLTTTQNHDDVGNGEIVDVQGLEELKETGEQNSIATTTTTGTTTTTTTTDDDCVEDSVMKQTGRLDGKEKENKEFIKADRKQDGNFHTRLTINV